MKPIDYPINNGTAPVEVVNFNGVRGSAIMYTAHYPRLHPSDFRVKTLEPFVAEDDRLTGVSGLVGDPAYPLHHPPMAPTPTRIGAIKGKR